MPEQPVRKRRQRFTHEEVELANNAVDSTTPTTKATVEKPATKSRSRALSEKKITVKELPHVEYTETQKKVLVSSTVDKMESLTISSTKRRVEARQVREKTPNDIIRNPAPVKRVRSGRAGSATETKQGSNKRAIDKPRDGNEFGPAVKRPRNITKNIEASSSSKQTKAVNGNRGSVDDIEDVLLATEISKKHIGAIRTESPLEKFKHTAKEVLSEEYLNVVKRMNVLHKPLCLNRIEECRAHHKKKYVSHISYDSKDTLFEIISY